MIIDVDGIVDRIPEVMTWEQVQELLHKVVPTQSDAEGIVGDYDVPPSQVEAIVDALRERSAYLVKQYFLGFKG